MVFVLWLACLLLLVPSVVVCIECFVSLIPKRGQKQVAETRPRVAILVPAHNEEAGVAKTIDSILPQMQQGDRLLVVADNCSDNTASVAADQGATVITRFDDAQLGKGFALDFGINWLRQDPPDVLVMVDADCCLEEGSLEILANRTLKVAGPVQALNLMINKVGANLPMKVAEFAWVVKNHVRPTGMAQMGLPCHLMGTGMAFPWQIIEEEGLLASDSLAEDMQLGLKLALKGHKTRFCPSAKVTSYFPTVKKDAETQRKRWEHGHIGMIVDFVPRMLLAALLKRDLGLFALAIDLMVPPLSLQSLLLLAGLMITVVFVPFGMIGPFFLVFVGSVFFVVGLMLAWFKYARHVITVRELLTVPSYIVSKLSVYVSYIFSRESKWIRTGRDDDNK